MVKNAAKHKLAAGELVLCLGLRQARSPDIAMIAAECGFDALYADMEHSPLSLETVSAICVGALGQSITPLVRPPSHAGDWISRALDGGAQGVIVPHVNDAAQAMAVVRNGRFPPLGHRSVMGPTPALGYRALPLGEINQTLNTETLIIVMLETPEGIANAEAIAAVPGIDLLLIGSNDLCTEMGIPGQLRHAKLRAAFETTAQACKKHGKTLGVGGIRGDLELQRDLVQLGARFIIAGNDTNYLAAAARKDVQALRELA
ncbi:MAG: aldolase [Betaproteobacteria bacterium]|nr:aldolase [Betaproteobacteria bacterium]